MASDNRAIATELVERCGDDLAKIDRRIRPGSLFGSGEAISELADFDIPGDETPREAVERLKADMRGFAEVEGLDHVTVVNVASTEPRVDLDQLPQTWHELQTLLDTAEGCPLRASSLYAIAAFELGFSHRNLQVMSWVGHNIFGNLDGKVLDNPVNKAGKVASKDHLLHEILEYSPQTLVSIEYIESLGDWKTAWDHIHFQGFLGTPMTLQFTWQGCDSLLAAPLVLDMVRLTDLARRRGEIGEMAFLASFFKSPQGVQEQGFVRQFQMLEEWADR
jgi:myo-inositol-1-phosphate synthase